jgi:DNA/RNA endonuclease YhcR with UshA esterase domain
MSGRNWGAGLFALVLMTSPAAASGLSAGEAAGKVGQQVTVDATVSEVKHFDKSGITLLDLDGQWPNQALTLFISGASASAFPDAGSLQGASVEASGVVTLYQGRPEIALTDPAQLVTK